jgi:molecular chaperone GrpE
MSEQPPAGASENAGVGRPAGLTPEAVEAVLADFRAWLREAAGPAAGPEAVPGEDGVDLHTLVAQFVALRHEVHLQTRAARAQQEQNAEALRQLGQAVAALEQTEPAEPTDEELLRPLLKTLVDVHDALSLAGREVQRVQEAVLASMESDAPPPDLPEPTAAPGPRPSVWARWFGQGGEQQEATATFLRETRAASAARAEKQRQALERVRRLLDSLVTGYTMSVQRVERVLAQSGLEPVPAVGQPFDPERMEVVAVAADSGRPAGEVVAEVRRGYLWRGRVFRYAQVSVAKG